MNITIITTIKHNIGDDFVREGIKYLLKSYFKNEKIEFQYIHKHSPITVRYGFERFRNKIYSKTKVDKIIPKIWCKDRISDADIVIQSGAPVYWCHEVGGSHCYQNEWYKPLIKERFLKNKAAKLLNIAAGACQRYNSDGSEFCDKCKGYIREFSDLANVTTVRDTLSNEVLTDMGIDVKTIPCTSIFAVDEYNLVSEGNDYVVVNYMKGGAHYTFGQNINFKKWEDEFRKFYYKLKEKEHVVFSCHNQKEVNDAREIDPQADIFYKKNDYLAYMKFYGRAKFGIMNRVHGAFLMASYGKPSIVIGNDSRANMAEMIGLRHYFVNSVDYALLTQEYEYLNSGADQFSVRFKNIKDRAFQDYINTLTVL